MDVERGRTVKGWRPRRLGEHFLPGLRPGGPHPLLHPSAASYLPFLFRLAWLFIIPFPPSGFSCHHHPS